MGLFYDVTYRYRSLLIVILPNKYGYFLNHSSISFSDNPC